MPGSIKATVLEVVDLPGDGGKKYAIQVSMGKTEYTTSPQAAFGAASGSASIRPFLADFSFPVMNLTHPLTLTLMDVKEDAAIGQATIEVPSIVEKGFRDEFLSFSSGGRIHVKTTFVLTDEERAKIAAMRKKKMEAAAAAAGGNRPTTPQTPPVSSSASPSATNGTATPAPESPFEPAPAPTLKPVPAPVPAATADSSPAPSSPKPHTESFPAGSEPSPRKPLSPAKADLSLRAPTPFPTPRMSLEGSASQYVPMPSPNPPTNRGAASPGSEGASQAAAQSEVDTSPFEQVRSRIKAIEELKEEMEKAPAGSLTREEARERLQTETEALAAAEELRRQELRRRGINPGNITGRNAREYSEMEANEGATNAFKDIPLIVKQVAGGVAAVLALVLLWPRGRRRSKPRARGVYVVRAGDRLAGLVPEHYCHPDSKFYALNEEVCESNYIYEGQPLYLP